MSSPSQLSDIEVSSKARKVLQKRTWASIRGKASRAYVRAHPDLEGLFLETGDVGELSDLPQDVTKASVVYVIADKLRRREITKTLRRWREDNPERAEAIRKQIRGDSSG
ncbi:hypothetical protein LCGC14_2147140 [marine sediment metagenome]|uniref:Uncharacterized protein n=1 Tax=marine sediment metagenome TaxID=412755 RepID=A0A0F9DWJ2_9ZZZZ